MTLIAKRYEIRIPWKGEPKFEKNFEMAYPRLSNVEKSLMKKSPEDTSEYNEMIEDYVYKNYIHKVTPKKRKNNVCYPTFL